MTTQLEPARKKVNKQLKIWIPAVTAVLVALITAASTLGSSWLQSRGASPNAIGIPGAVSADPRPSMAAPATTIPPKILQPTNNKLIDICITVKGTAPPLHGERAYWLLIRNPSNNHHWISSEILVGPDGSWIVPRVQVGMPYTKAVLELLLVRTDADLTAKWRALDWKDPITMPSAGVDRLNNIQVHREPRPGSCTTPTASVRPSPS